MAAAAVDVGYLAASYAVPETTLQSLLSQPTVALVQTLLVQIEARAREHDDLTSEKIKAEVELEAAVQGGEARARSLKAVADKATLERVERDRQDGLDLGVQGTPTFFLNGKKLEPTSTQDFRDQIDAFVNDPEVEVVVCSLTAAGVGLNLQVASNVVLAELSWTDAEQTQAIDRVHRIGQAEPVTAWRVIAAQTIDTKIAELIDSKAGLAAKALDGSDEEISSSADVQLEALVALLTQALTERG